MRTCSLPGDVREAVREARAVHRWAAELRVGLRLCTMTCTGLIASRCDADIQTYEKTRMEIYQELAEIAKECGVDNGDFMRLLVLQTAGGKTNSGNLTGTALKAVVKHHRQVCTLRGVNRGQPVGELLWRDRFACPLLTPSLLFAKPFYPHRSEEFM